MSTVPIARQEAAEAGPDSCNDPVLRALLDSADGASRSDAIEHLLVSVALPIIESVVRRKSGRFGVRLRFRPEDEEDIRSSALYRIVRRLSADLRTHVILSFESYVAAVAAHVCDEHLRCYSPEWTLLRRRLRSILRDDARFAMWPDRNEVFCGRAGWRERPPAIRVPVASLSDMVPNGVSLSESLDWVFNETGAPVLLSEAVAILAPRYAYAAAAAHLPVLEEIADETILHADALVEKETAASVWSEIELLPVDQRRALLLNLRDSRRGSALRYFPLTGVATVRDLAAALELDDDRLAVLWPLLPMPDADIAELFGMTRQRVINLRSAARERLVRRMKWEVDR